MNSRLWRHMDGIARRLEPAAHKKERRRLDTRYVKAPKENALARVGGFSSFGQLHIGIRSGETLNKAGLFAMGDGYV